jgi:hypothetical protein
MTESKKKLCFTIKKSLKRSTWQAKGRHHELISLHDLHPIIYAVLPEYGIDSDDRHSLVELCIAAEAGEGVQVELERETDTNTLAARPFKSGQGPLYRLARGADGAAEGPYEMPLSLILRLGEAPERLFLSFAPATDASYL